MTTRPSRHGLPLPAKLANATEELQEKAAYERTTRLKALDALAYVQRDLGRGDRLAADACYRAFLALYGAWQAADSALAQITTLVATYQRHLEETTREPTAAAPAPAPDPRATDPSRLPAHDHRPLRRLPD